MAVSKRFGVAIQITLLVLVALTAGWLLRGAYDDTVGSWNSYTVVNLTDQDRKVEISFPSGRREAFIAGRTPYRLKQHDTGEGSLNVTVDGEDLGTHGYVSGMNPPQIIVIAENTSGLYMRMMPAGK